MITVLIAGIIMIPLTFLHFVGDWLFQTSEMAMHKASNWKVRAVHCLCYTAVFLPILYSLSSAFIFYLSFIFLTHFFIDTRLPVYWWVKYMNKDKAGDNMEAFMASMGNHIRFTVNIVYDQIMHIVVLYIVACLVTGSLL